MLEELEPDLCEIDLRRIVDFGHGFSPLFEMKVIDELLHGEAVAIDMAISTVISANRDLLDWQSANRISNLLNKIGLLITHEVCTEDCLIDSLSDVAKHRGGRQSLPIPLQIGTARFLDDVSLDECNTAYSYLAEFFSQYTRPSNRELIDASGI
ncbi:MAG: 3-dehydroquinate synthase (EC [uncultured Caballeronia sp.]|nr:MAG: 3-dehydroquinate synthase (EC [uncultured Caballeronia sp.]